MQSKQDLSLSFPPNRGKNKFTLFLQLVHNCFPNTSKQTPQSARYYLLTLTFILTCLFARAQGDTTVFKKLHKQFDPNSAIMFVPNYNAQFPFGHVAQRFGFDNLVSLEILYKTNKNWLVGVNGGFIYGSNSKQNYVFSNIATSTGQFITQYNDLTAIRPQEQGFNIQFTFGKIIPLTEKLPDAGIMFLTGLGAVADKIAVSVKAAELPQLSPQYRKGYDRMNVGPVLSQFVGYNYMARSRFFAGYIGLQADLSYTENVRPYDFYTMGKLNDKGVDLFLGLKVGFIIAKYMQASEKEYFYY
jgi:hypothetical protein